MEHQKYFLYKKKIHQKEGHYKLTKGMGIRKLNLLEEEKKSFEERSKTNCFNKV